MFRAYNTLDARHQAYKMTIALKQLKVWEGRQTRTDTHGHTCTHTR